MSGGLLVTGTSSDAGKSLVTAGICRWLARCGLRVAPFKAQNMALNSAVAADGAEIGRAQALQAAAAGAPTEAAMNPVLLKPTGERTSQVVVLGRPDGIAGAQDYQQRKTRLAGVVAESLADLRARYDVVVCEGAGSPAEINLRHADLANLGLARAADLPVVLVGDIDRGGAFASLYGTLALLEPADQRLVAGFLLNKFRGDPEVLAPGLEQLAALTGRRVLGTLPWLEGAWLDVEDSLTLEAREVLAQPPVGDEGLDVAVARLPRMSNFTDLDPLACEPGVDVRFTTRADELANADLAVIPGSKATVDDLAFCRERGLARAVVERARRGAPVLGLCGGYQMLGRAIIDDVESAAGRVEGLGLLPIDTRFWAEKHTTWRVGTSPLFGGVPAGGYEIRHGRVSSDGDPWLVSDDGEVEGCVAGAVLGTSWHGLLEHDALRRRLLGWVADRRGRAFVPGEVSFEAVRERHLDRLGDLVADHADTAALRALVVHGAPADLPVVPPAPAVPTTDSPHNSSHEVSA
ncbi:cobyric acid synthase [Egibacter rhizosphaerae]|uniref:Cobyric acid synthase n=1 Tax=Egibacter rhizosphaerae TaxID=1670831 RepID=A0A411YEY8_9ACTN|nr:cobyric acid synthase [Egibacter rhizosphaerae]QBI19824.1 cobyric acid synthase [Egibacter rhizosphaerae]